MTPEDDKKPVEPEVEEPEPPAPEEPPELPEEVPSPEPEPYAETLSEEEEALVIGPEEEWIEEYEAEELEPEEPRRPKRRRHVAGPIVAAVIVIFLIIWTVLSPSVMSVAGDTYITSSTYANLGNYTFAHDTRIAADLIDAGEVVWGVSISGSLNATVGVSTIFMITVSKISEETGNFWFMGTSISLKDASVFLENGALLGSMSAHTKTQFGPTASIPVTFDEPGEYELVGYVRFTVYEVMRIGFLPSQEVEITDLFFEFPIDVTE